MDINSIVSLLIVWLVTSASFLLISRIPLIGVEVDSLKISLISAAVLGIVNALIKPILELFGAVPNFFTLGLASGLIAFIISVICFGITARVVEGFRLRNGIWSAIFGALALSVVYNFISNFIYQILG